MNDNKQFVCSNCGGTFPMHKMYEIELKQLCPSCVDVITVICKQCGARILRENNMGTNNYPLCDRCYVNSINRQRPFY